jgi:glycosyltransferase involved in cell wall biosynthesis
MRIAFVLNSLANSGTNIATRDLICQLKKAYVLDIDVFVFDATDDGLHINVTTIKIDFFSKIDFSKYDIVHSSTLRSDLFVCMKKIFSFKKCNTKYVTSIHNIIEEDLLYSYGKFVSKVISVIWIEIKKNNGAIIVSSQSMYVFYENLLNVKKLHIIEYGRSINPVSDFEVPNSDIKLIEKLRANYKVIGTIGTLTKRKNYSVVIDLLNRYQDYAWVSLGVGDEYEGLMELVKVNKLEDRVNFLGFRTDSRPYYKYFDLLFHPSRSEGFSLVLIDAMSHKCPLLLSKLLVYESILKEDMVFYFDLDDDGSLFKAFEMLQNDPNQRSKAIEKSYAIYETKFSMEECGLKHYKIFNDLIQSD